MKRFLMIAAIVIAMPLVGAACGSGEQTADGYENASVAHAYEHWQQGDQSKIQFMLLDVRTPEEYQAGHVPGAKLIALNTLPAQVDAFPKQGDVFLICRSGTRSAQAADDLARQCGNTNLINIEGGTMAWMQAGYPVE